MNYDGFDLKKCLKWEELYVNFLKEIKFFFLNLIDKIFLWII